MKKKGIYFLVFALTVFILPLQAQVTFSISPLTVDPETTFSADIKVSSFTDIAGVQFTLQWDPAVLEFQGVENFGIELNDINFNADDAVSEGTLRFLWFDPLGVTLEDGSIFYSIVFDAIGAPGDTTSIAFTSEPLQIEVTDVNENLVDANFESGQVLLFDPTAATYVSAPDLFVMRPGIPNPFYENVQIEIDIRLATDASITIIGPDGKEAFAENRFFTPGKHLLFFTKDTFPTAGTYFFQLTAPGLRATQQLVRL